MNNALAIVPLQDMQSMADAMAHSGLFGMKNPVQALALMLVAQAEGQHPASIAQDYDVIQGKATRKTHSVLSRFQAAGGRVEWHALTEQQADATFSHPAGGALRMEWTFEQAKKAGLTGKDNWKNYPRAMLRARCIAEGVRAVYPAALGGLMVAEEAMDMPAPAKDMGPVDEVKGMRPAAAPAPAPDPAVLVNARAAADKGREAFAQFWKAATKEQRAALKDELGDLQRRTAAADAARTVDAPPPATTASDAPADGADPWLAEMDAAENGGAK